MAVQGSDAMGDPVDVGMFAIGQRDDGEPVIGIAYL